MPAHDNPPHMLEGKGSCNRVINSVQEVNNPIGVMVARRIGHRWMARWKAAILQKEMVHAHF